MQMYEYTRKVLNIVNESICNHSFPFIKTILDNLYQLLTLHIYTSNIIKILQFKKILWYIYLGCVCVYVHTYMWSCVHMCLHRYTCYSALMNVRERLSGVSSLLLSCGLSCCAVYYRLACKILGGSLVSDCIFQ